MKIPNKISVLGDTVRIKKIKSWDGHKDVPSGLVGRFYPDTLTIYICTAFNREAQERFLLHELNHVVLHVSGADQTLSLEMQEVLAQSFSSFYFNAMKVL